MNKIEIETFNFKKSVIRVSVLLVLVLVLFAVAWYLYMFTGELEPNPDMEFGLTFSQVFAEEMGSDWRASYLAMLDDLGVRKLRLVAYWQKIEPERGKYYFDDLDWQIQEAEKRGAEIILVMGQKVPRWPECHTPDWARELSESIRRERVLLLLTEIVNHYQDSPAIEIWQVENEAFLTSFGECPKFDPKFLEKEIALVRRLDRKARPIMLTASGELSSWTEPASRADVLGTTLYRIIWSETFGHIEYPIPPIFYFKRAKWVKFVTGIDKIIIIELQGEPWSPKMIYETPDNVQEISMNLEYFLETIEYTRKTGFDEAYLWGVEWWYQKKQDGNDGMWEIARNLWVD